MRREIQWYEELGADVRFGYLDHGVAAPRQHHPQVVLNESGSSVLRIIREELKRADSFTFSVAFVTTRAIALLKQEIAEFEGNGCIVTSDYLAFNSPEAFAELHNLRQLGVDIRIHSATGFHPKGYIFEQPDAITAMVGSSNLTHNALVTNHEWNLKVSAAPGSDLAGQVARLIDREIGESAPLTPDWITEYAAAYTAPAPRPPRELPAPPLPPLEPTAGDADTEIGLPLRAPRPDLTRPRTAAKPPAPPLITPNQMQRDALVALDDVRAAGNQRAIVISATGTGKTMLSALDVRSFDPQRMLFVVHREQILDRTIEEYRKVLGGESGDYGKLTGTSKQQGRRYLFATVQTLSQPRVLDQFDPEAFDYLIIDEAHRAGAPSYQRLLEHFDPQFLLGMTATPERTDGFNVFELFDYNVPYEIRLTHALEEDMLSPFHYYGVADVTLEDGSTLTGDEDLGVLASRFRADHLLTNIAIYAQAGVQPRGLIFCSRKDEAHALSEELNGRELHGRPLRTIALTGDDSIAAREATVRRLERGELDYILTVDIFNEGVDIPSINQVIMLRQTQSAIVFVQQLGRGLRKFVGKEYLVVIDFIGNYANNYLIPIALFGDESLNKESLRQNLIAAEEAGVLPGLSSIRFDRVSQSRVLRSIGDSNLDSMQNLKSAIELLRNRLGRIPDLWDFLRFESVDPVLLATKKENYPALVAHVLRLDPSLTKRQNQALGVISHEVLTAKRPHEFVLLRALLRESALSRQRVAELFAEAGIPATDCHVTSTIDTFTLAEHAEADIRRYGEGVAEAVDDLVALTPAFESYYRESGVFARAVDDALRTGNRLVGERYSVTDPFTAGRQYSRKEVTRLLGMPRKWTSTLYGYRVDRARDACPIFVTLHKSDDIEASTAYEDALLNRSTMLWYTRSRRTLESDEVRAIVGNEVALHVFVKKDDAEGSGFYYLGDATAEDAEQTTMPDKHGNPLDVVRMHLHFTAPIDGALYDYFHPVVTA